jgi:geranylgeranyl diphosphate synthase type II
VEKVDFKSKTKEITAIVESALDKNIPTGKNRLQQEVYEAMRYSLFAGGKRLRPVLAIATCEALGGNIEDVLPYACAFEMIHTYTLIMDDLPCMDDDDLRRGMPTCHKMFKESTAILAAMGLFNNAVMIMKNAILSKSPDKRDKFERAMSEIIDVTGAEGLIGGQIVDLASTKETTDKDTLHFIHHHKTGVFVTAPVRVGAIIADATEEQLEKLTEFSKNLGLAYQIQDDILNVIGDEAKLGKKVGSDEKQNKATFPSIYGLKESQEMVAEISKKSGDALDILGEKGEYLRQLTKYCANRDS